MATLTNKIATSAYSRRLCYQLKNLYSQNIKSTTERSFSKTCFQLSNRKYSEKHEWVVLNGKIGTIGVSHYAQDALGDVVFVQTPDIGMKTLKDEEVGVIESVKAVNEIYSPVSGTITEVNEKLADKPSLINESCYDEGWIYKLEISDTKEVDALMEEDAYQKYLKSIH